ncbi:DUF2163 domain-containing protein [Rhizobium panacihumi]|uniref:DUF2163 domain-containing protein n=1 Tax=Rhizobium panacihumi TaxID=2008450 RepID=UPI003D7BFE4B
MLSPEVQALYDEGRIDVRQMLKFAFGSGTYGFIADRSELVWQGVTYIPFGLIKVSDLESGNGTTANSNFTLTLAASPDDGVTPEKLKQIENEDYRDRPVTLYDAYFHPDTKELLQVEPVARGYLDVIDHEDDDGSGYVLIGRCEGRQLDYTRTNGRVRSTADQQRRSPGDMFYQYAGQAGRMELPWGRVKAVAAAAGATVGTILQSLRTG